ncbi:MAG: hypothetical protein WBC71_07380 [Salaquimonas sp.]
MAIKYSPAKPAADNEKSSAKTASPKTLPVKKPEESETDPSAK